MGAVIGKAANGIGAAIGNAFTAPFKPIFGASCEDLCSGTWDFTCFIEHLCVSNIVRLLMVLGLCYIILMFIYLMFQLGIIQCVGRSLCKLCWFACRSYCHAIKDFTCCLWYKLKNTKRVNRRRRHRYRDIEEGYSSSEDSIQRYRTLNTSRKRKWNREKKTARPLYPVKLKSLARYQSRSRSSHHHGLRWKTSEVSVHLKGGSRRLRNSKQLQIRRPGNLGKQMRVFKRRKMIR
ncbi:hypothetical protein MKW98_020962 [Papaver atlanticum]|uniref:Uncharacterized protein n=1 Tax=Papaver atlanticum TaxID=357466 RepID=A0AAD4SNK8_9MAGN|nr:hypothetical protein MKW98_020962 [Papaver atlanticum]